MPISDTHRRRTTCRICGGKGLKMFLSLGPSPLANGFLRAEDLNIDPVYPLDVYFCTACHLIQLLDVIEPEVLFRHYLYVTGTSDTIAAHNTEYAATVAARLNLTPADLVVEVASNDGSLLECFRRHGVRTLGVDPAANVAAIANARGIETINRFFSSGVAVEIRQQFGPAKTVIANNVLAHVDDPVDLLSGAACLLDGNGAVTFEVPYLVDLVDGLEYDTIYHEHLSYFSVTSIMQLCDRAGLSIDRVEHLPVHGGSLRVTAAQRRQGDVHCSDAQAMAADEARRGMGTLEFYEAFADVVRSNRVANLGLLNGLMAAGATVAGYGAPAKGNTFLNYCGMDCGMIPFTVDKNPLKVGLYTPGMHIPVLPVSTIEERRPDYLLILPWNFAEEIMRQQEPYRAAGGRFIIPVPEPRVV